MDLLLQGVHMCVCVRVQKKSVQISFGGLEGNQLHIGVSQRFPVRSAELPEDIQYKQNSPILQGI